MDAFLNEISQLGRQDSVILEIDSSEEGAGIRQQQRTDELQSLLAIFGSEMEVVDHELIRFLVYQDQEPTKPHAPLESMHVTFLLHEEYPSFPIVFELQGPCLLFSEADAVFFELFKQACDNAGNPTVFMLLDSARDRVSAIIDTRRAKNASSANLEKNSYDFDHFLFPGRMDDNDDSSESSYLGSLDHIAATNSNDPSFYLQRGVADVLAEITNAAFGMSVVVVENILRIDLAVRFLKYSEHHRCHRSQPTRGTSRYLRSKRFGQRDVITQKHLENDPVVAYHGTSNARIPSIVRQGLLVPGLGVGSSVSQKTGVGYYGKGIYLSPDPMVSLGYAEGGAARLLVCAVTLGHTYMCDTEMYDAPLQAGYNSHISPCLVEYVAFNPAQVLPVLLVHLQNRAHVRVSGTTSSQGKAAHTTSLISIPKK